jgi:hypothetical protein
VARPSAAQAIDPTVKTMNPNPVIRAPRLEATISAAIVVASGAM